ncbi:cellulose synthase/poly-beta-1,6-N-acetylglucosamine synthase-like glycosyltransferase [Paenibacillus castaneae]|uniref:glycosyltransferase n=1 Tax=Paenibacillus castaneae TaxID=474957 RepID=UPI000C9A93E9|nr:glycosyltransferase [Paenibacillus castaneae]NIK76020.1 cellulose synthase/poly-beta-1,6-N-acetylglucosamine synthase-like glycosyltransferase [Paenibacillus castaneae]
MEIILWTVAVLLLAQLLFAVWNVRQLPLFEQLGQAEAPLKPISKLAAEENVRLSILIPARNEERHMAHCLYAIQQCLSDEHEVEIVVLDDRSEDDTARIIEEFVKQDKRFRFISGQELPIGWIGKAYACHQLSVAAKGAWFLFIDADARMQPGAIETVLRATAVRQTGLLTGFPYQQTKSWLERLVVPMMGFTIACHLPIKLVSNSTDPRFSAAHGAWIVVNRETYEAAGGHAANFAHLVDDLALIQAVKRIGHHVVLADVRNQVSMRMYQNASEVWNGYKKNIFAGVGRSGLLLFMVLFVYSVLYVLPFAALIAVPWNPALLASALTGYLLGTAVKAVSDRAGGQSVWLAPLIPFSIGAVIAIGTASWLSAKAGKGYVWKGRSYE